MNPAILNSEVQKFINEHLNDDTNRILLGKSPFEGVSSKELTEQIESKKRSEKKLPSWYNSKDIYYPSRLAIEQSSSEQTAKYKSHLARTGNLIDLTGGFGVDSYHFSKKAKNVICVEQNPDLSEIGQYNAKVLGADNIRFVSQDSLTYLKNTNEIFDTIFMDPSRRIRSNKVFMLKDCEPDITVHLDLLLSKAGRVIIKTSPLLDIQSGLKDLKHVHEIHVVSVKNDCKELLWIIDRDCTEELEIHCSAIREFDTQTFSFKLSEERAFTLQSYSLPLEFIYEPDVALLKAGCFKLIAKHYNVEKLHPNTHLYTSSEKQENFAGRIFKVISVIEYKIFMKDKRVKKANVITRNFPLSPDELKKKHKLEDGGEDYLLFTRGPADQLLAIHAKRL